MSFTVCCSPFIAFQQDILLNENLPQPVIDLPGVSNSEQSTVNSPRSPLTAHCSQQELHLETTAALAGSGQLFAEQPLAWKRMKGGMS
jgi:hypothetical protein